MLHITNMSSFSRRAHAAACRVLMPFYVIMPSIVADEATFIHNPSRQLWAIGCGPPGPQATSLAGKPTRPRSIIRQALQSPERRPLQRKRHCPERLGLFWHSARGPSEG